MVNFFASRVGQMAAQKFAQGVEQKIAQKAEQKASQGVEKRLTEGLATTVEDVASPMIDTLSDVFSSVAENYGKFNEMLRMAGKGPLHEEAASEYLERKIMTPIKSEAHDTMKEQFRALSSSPFVRSMITNCGKSYQDTPTLLRSPIYPQFYSSVHATPMRSSRVSDE